MSDLALLFLVLALLYGWECACWVGRGAICVRSWLGVRWRLARPSGLLGNPRGGFVFVHLLPPLGRLLTGCQWPFSVSPDAVLAFVASGVNPGGPSAQGEKCFRFAEIREVEAHGKQVRINGQVLVKAESPSLAEHLARQVRELRELPAEKRAEAICQRLRESLNVKAVEARWQEFRHQTARLRLMAIFLFLYVFAGAPLLIDHFGLERCWLGLVLGLFACTLTLAVLFRRIHQRLYAAAAEERFNQFLILLLSPVTAIRVLDLLSRPLLQSFHPLALAKVFCAPETFERLARELWREIRYPARRLRSTDPVAQAAERQGHAALQNAVEDFLQSSGLDPEKLLAAPAPADETCRSYCPRCLAQFTVPAGRCEDCGGLALKALAAGVVGSK